MPLLKFKGEAEWLSLREMHVGGSEVAALFNRWRLPDGTELIYHLYQEVPEGSILIESCSPYTTGYRLFMEKSGRLPPNFEANERMMAGNFMEPAIASFAMAKWSDWKLHKSRVYHAHETIKGWGASLDYFVVKPGKPPCDVKNVDKFIFDKTWTAEGGNVVGMPLHINLQLQHQIGAVGESAMESWILACVGGNALYRGMVPRHQPTLDFIGEAITAFWAGVEAGVPPTGADYATVAEIHAEGIKDQRINLADDEEACRVVRRYERWKGHYDFVDGHLDRIKGRLADKLGENTGADLGSHKVSWPVIKRKAGHVSYEVKEATYRGGLKVTPVKA